MRRLLKVSPSAGIARLCATKAKGLLTNAILHVLAEVPLAGVSTADLEARVAAYPGCSTPASHGFATFQEALATANDTHYVSDGRVYPCDWHRVMHRIKAKLPAEGVLEPAFARYLAAESLCSKFRRGPINGVAMPAWVAKHFASAISVETITGGVVYKPVETFDPHVALLRSAVACLGCTAPQHMPAAIPLADIAALIPVLPTDARTGKPFTWPAFLQQPAVIEHFSLSVELLVSAKAASKTQLVFVDGTTVGPDEGEAAAHRLRQKDGALSRLEVHVVRGEEHPPHSSADILIDGIVEAHHAIAAKLASLRGAAGSHTAAVAAPLNDSGVDGITEELAAAALEPASSGFLPDLYAQSVVIVVGSAAGRRMMEEGLSDFGSAVSVIVV